MPWKTEGLLTNPVAGTVLADSGFRNTGQEKYTVVLWNDQEGGQLKLEIAMCHEDHPPVAQNLTFGSGTTIFSLPVTMGPRQRVQIRLREDFFGELQVSLIS